MTRASPAPGQRPRVLVVAYHYPPVAGSSGVQRTLKFTAYLRDFGWEPLVLTVHPRAYERVSNDQIGDIPAGLRVERAFAVDSARHLSFRGRFPRRFAMPDRWFSWWPAAVWTGLRMIREEQPAVLMSTFPIATAHAVAATLQRRSGLPWLADFRDNMTDPAYPPDPVIWRHNRRLEETTVRRCTRAIFTTQGTRQMYAQRYADLPDSRWAVVENGFDEENFREAAAHKPAPTPAPAAAQAPGAPLRLIHSGILYPEERDPRAFFAAVQALKRSGEISAQTLRIVLRATASDAVYRPMLASAGIADIIELAPPVDYRSALAEMLAADGLLLFQAAMANHQIPAKLYEYLRAGRPILALTDPAGDTAGALRDSGCGVICRLDDAQDIRAALLRFLSGVRSGALHGASPEQAARYSRRARTQELAQLLDEVSRPTPRI